jgi:NADPH:quinone reductase-like Zn-dependent oxidoreductase
MKAIRIHQRAGVEGLVYEDAPDPHPNEGDVVVQVHAAAFTPGELEWPGTWADRAGRDRIPSIPGHEVAGVVTAVGYGTPGFTVGDRVFGLTDWRRDGTAAEYVAVEARNLAPLPDAIDYVQAAALPLAGLTVWQALFDHGGLTAGQTVLIHGAGGGVGTLAIQLARIAGAHVIATGRERVRDLTLELGAERFIDLDRERFEDAVDKVDLVFDTIGGDILARSARIVKPGGALVTISAPAPVQPDGARAVFFIVEPDRRQLVELARLVESGSLRSYIGAVYPLVEAAAAFQAKSGTAGKIVLDPSK